MKGEYRFKKLQDYIKSMSEDNIELTFSEIETILGFKLCKSAYEYSTYWHPSPTHTITLAWQEVGYQLTSVNLKSKVVRFARTEELVITDEVNQIDDKYQDSYSVIHIPNLSTDDTERIFNSGLKFFNNLKSDENARYLSWEHCYKEFQKNRNLELTAEVIDYLSLQLAFYLASWGMYRGSSFLLQKDYKVHNQAIIEIYKSEYKQLWNIKCIDYLEDDTIRVLTKLSKELEKIYILHRQNIDGRQEVSDILITKILMGTLGCVPAYDRFFIAAIKKYKVASSTYNENSIKSLAKFYQANLFQLEQIRTLISEEGLEYPQMKIIDMCFWQIGYEDDLEQNAKKDKA